MGWFGEQKKRTLYLSCEKSAFETYLAGEILFPLVGAQGEILAPVVDKGETVKAGVVVAGEEGCELRCPVSGKIEDIGGAPYPTGLRSVPVLRIKPEDPETDEAAIDPMESSDSGELWDQVRKAGLPATLAGFTTDACFPWADGSNPQADILVISGADIDVGLTARVQRSRESLDELHAAAETVKKLFGAGLIRFALPKKVSDEFKALGTGSLELDERYPTSMDRLIKTAMANQGGEGKISVISVHLALALHSIIAKGVLPRFADLTVGDRNGKKKNLRVLVGTRAGDVLQHAGMAYESGDRLLFGGPMTGLAQFDPDTPVLAGMDGLTVVPGAEHDEYRSRPCVNCGACTDVCPARLQPQEMGRYCEYGRYEEAATLDYCIECGLCTYVCPSYRPLKQWFTMGKKILAKSE